MDFKALGLEHIELLRPYFMKNLCRICDCTIGGTFIWRDLFKTEFAIAGGLLYLSQISDRRYRVYAAQGEPGDEGSVRKMSITRCGRVCSRLCAVHGTAWSV